MIPAPATNVAAATLQLRKVRSVTIDGRFMEVVRRARCECAAREWRRDNRCAASGRSAPAGQGGVRLQGGHGPLGVNESGAPSAHASASVNPWFGRAMAALRIYFGVVFLHNGVAKVLPAVPNLWPNTPLGFVIDAEGARRILEAEVLAGQHPVEPYRLLIQEFVLPNSGPFLLLLGSTEVAVGFLLIVGLLTPLAALLAAVMVLHLQFATLWNNKWLYEYSVEWLPLLCLAAFRAGRWHGLDARFAATRSRWFG